MQKKIKTIQNYLEMPWPKISSFTIENFIDLQIWV